MNFFIDAIQKYADFSGRATRQQYWMFMLFYILIYIGLSLIDAALGSSGVGILSLLFTLGLLVPSTAILARRLHDIGKSGWWMLLLLIPLVGLIILVFAIMDSEKGSNQYGESTKYGPAKSIE